LYKPIISTYYMPNIIVNFQQDRQYTYNVTMRCVRVTMKSNKYYIFWVHVCSLIHLERNMDGSYLMVICGLSGSPCSFILSRKWHDFWGEGEYWTWHDCFDFLHNSVWNISHSKKKRARCCHICTYVGLHAKYLLFLSEFNP